MWAGTMARLGESKLEVNTGALGPPCAGLSFRDAAFDGVSKFGVGPRRWNPDLDQGVDFPGVFGWTPLGR